MAGKRLYSALWQRLCTYAQVNQTTCAMLQRLQNAFASMDQMVRNQERTANNLANVETAGYKRDRVFIEALNERLDNEGAPRTDRLPTQFADLTEGDLDRTDNPLDVALTGPGFFVVEDEASGEMRYTRDGRFVQDNEGMIRSTDGALLHTENGPLVMPPDASSIEISQDGLVRVNGEESGRIRVVDFNDPMDLERREGATFVTDQQPVELEQPAMQQGFIEGSNVNALHEMTEMMSHFRLFESQQKAMQTTDQILGQLVRDTGRF